MLRFKPYPQTLNIKPFAHNPTQNLPLKHQTLHPNRQSVIDLLLGAEHAAVWLAGGSCKERGLRGTGVSRPRSQDTRRQTMVRKVQALGCAAQMCPRASSMSCVYVAASIETCIDDSLVCTAYSSRSSALCSTHVHLHNSTTAGGLAVSTNLSTNQS